MSTNPLTVKFYDYHPAGASLREEVLAGLSASPKRIAPKFFYDAEGARLFDAICETPEYYPTRTERGLLGEHAEEIAAALGAGCFLIEPGCGNCSKVRLLLEPLSPRAYMPLDICRTYLKQSAEALSRDFPWLELHVTCADFTQLEALPRSAGTQRHAAFFPGSTIGNFEPAQAREFLAQMAALLGSGGRALIGVDVKKPAAILDAAYNDAQGITAAFNLNLLERINRELEADFDLQQFAHRAFYNAEAGRVEMHLVSRVAQTVTVAGQSFEFAEGETIHSESSYKYAPEEFRQLATEAGFVPRALWQDGERLFSLHLLEVA